MQVKTGSYTGSGSDNNSISGVGFAPDVVFIQKDGGFWDMSWKTVDMGGTNSLNFWHSSFLTNAIKSLDSDGFTLGTNGDVNAGSTTYYWIAIKQKAGVCKVGKYTGTGSAHDITGLGFQPDFVMLKGTPHANPRMWFASKGGNNTYQFTESGPAATGEITGVVSDGFSVGTANAVNQNTIDYFYIAFKQSVGEVEQDTYAGNGSDDRNIVQPDPFKPTWLIIREDSSTTSRAIHKPDSLAGDNAFASSGSSNSGFKQADHIQALNNDGFQVGLGGYTNVSATNYHYLSLLFVDSPTPTIRGYARVSNAPTVEHRGVLSGIAKGSTRAFPIAGQFIQHTVQTVAVGRSTVRSVSIREIPLSGSVKGRGFTGGSVVVDQPVLVVSFDVDVALDQALPIDFDVFVEELQALLVEFDVVEQLDALAVSFDVKEQALVDAFSQDVQHPTAEAG